VDARATRDADGNRWRRIEMRGTLVCAVTDGDESGDALAVAAELSARLRLRLVLAHPVDGVVGNGHADESVGTRASRQGAERRLARLAAEHGVASRAERRIALGEPAALLGRIAAEEAADMIVVGARARGLRRRLESRLADELETETPVPVLIAAPRSRREPKDPRRTDDGANVEP
jgi:nucleotide-binding universal stress UspA family protein